MNHISISPPTVHEKNNAGNMLSICPLSRHRVSDEPSPDICTPPPWLVDDAQVDRCHPVGVSQRADGVEAGAGQDKLGEVGSLVVLAANDPRHQREGGRVGQHVAGVPVERREGAVARTPQVRAQLVRPLVELGRETIRFNPTVHLQGAPRLSLSICLVIGHASYFEGVW